MIKVLQRLSWKRIEDPNSGNTQYVVGYEAEPGYYKLACADANSEEEAIQKIRDVGETILSVYDCHINDGKRIT